MPKGGEYGTALQVASAEGHKEIVEMLLDYHVE
jgi:ankyrin repeat protein